MKSFSNKTSTILCDNDSNFIRSASDSTELSDEDKLNFIALSLPPFSPSTDSVLETTTEKNNSNTILLVSQPNNEQPDSTLTATESDIDIDPSIRPMDAEAKINKNKRKKDQSTASVSKRQVLGEGDSHSFKGKANCATNSSSCAAASADLQDLPLPNANMYGLGSPGPFDVIVQRISFFFSIGSLQSVAVGHSVRFVRLFI